LDPEKFVFMNTDTDVHLHRVPVGNDFALRAAGRSARRHRRDDRDIFDGKVLSAPWPRRCWCSASPKRS
jgi:hypothetical protein